MEIKFRAWIKDENKMVHGYDATANSIFTCGFRYRRNEIELMQYTGLKDRNDKEGYREDIVNHDKYGNFIIIWDDVEASFILKSIEQKYGALPMSLLKDCNIIGNVYDNPELIRSQK
jgi:uncharacterized phage protein (TIGR01671 family)